MDPYALPPIDPVTGLPLDPMMADPMAAPPMDPLMDPLMGGPVMDPMMPPVDPMMQMQPLPPMLPEPVPPPPDWDMFADEPDVPVGNTDPDYVPAKRPVQADVMEDCDELMAEHEPRLDMARQMADFLTPDRAIGHFEIDDEDIANGDVELMSLNTIRADHEYNCGVIAAMDPYVEHLSRERIDDDEVLAIEDSVYWDMACEERQHHRATGGLLKRAMPNILQRTGALVGLDTVDPDDDLCGLRMSLIDPLTVFPVFEGAAGLTEVYRVYEDVSPNIIGNYQDTTESVRKEVTRIAGKTSNGRTNRLNLLEVREVWNKDWVAVYVEQEEILARRHGYGFVPFTVTLGGFDVPPGMSTGNTVYWGADTPEPGLHHSEDRSGDLARWWTPWAWRAMPAHLVAEAVAGRTLTQFVRDFEPALVYEFDPITRDQDVGEFGYGRKHVNKVPLGNKLGIMPSGPSDSTVAALNIYMGQNAEQGPWSQLRSGNIPPQTADSALGTMFELGGADRGALTDTIATFRRERAEKRLRLREMFGSVLKGPDKKRSGVMSVPSYGDADTPSRQLTPEMITRAGPYINFEMFYFRPNPGSAQYYSSLVSSGLISERTARRRLRIVPDPLREEQRIKDEQLERLPEVVTQHSISRLNKRVDKAVDEGDYESADQDLVSIAQLEFNAEMMVMSGTAPAPEVPVPPGAGAGPSTPLPPSPASATPPLNQQGLSLPQVGVGTGRSGGRPQGAKEPTGVTRPISATAPK